MYMPHAFKFMYPTSGVTFILGNGEEVVVRTYGSDSCVHVEVRAHVCMCVCMCVVCTQKHTHIYPAVTIHLQLTQGIMLPHQANTFSWLI
jgi:hypothetical protein